MVLDFRKVNRGEVVAALGGIGLIVIMLAVKWYGIEQPLLSEDLDTFRREECCTRDAFESFTFLDFGLLFVALAAIALLLLTAAQVNPFPRIQWPAVIGALGAAAFLLIAVRIVSPPDLALTYEGVTTEVSDSDEAEVTRNIGPWLALVASAAIALGGLLARRRPS